MDLKPSPRMVRSLIKSIIISNGNQVKHKIWVYNQWLNSKYGSYSSLVGFGQDSSL